MGRTALGAYQYQYIFSYFILFHWLKKKKSVSSSFVFAFSPTLAGDPSTKQRQNQVCGTWDRHDFRFYFKTRSAILRHTHEPLTGILDCSLASVCTGMKSNSIPMKRSPLAGWWTCAVLLWGTLVSLGYFTVSLQFCRRCQTSSGQGMC